MPVGLDGVVPSMRPSLVYGDILVGEPVRGSTMQALGKLAAWVRGRGRCLVPSHACRTTLSGAGATAVHHYKARPSGVALSRVWVGSVHSSVAAGRYDGLFTFTAGTDGPSRTWVVGTRYAGSVPFLFVETAGVTLSTAITDLTFKTQLDAGGSADVVLETLACYELPRAALARTATDLGVALDALGARRPVLDLTYEGPKALANTIATFDAKRGGLTAMWVDGSLTTTSAAYVNVFDTDIPIVPSKNLPTDTTRTCTWDVYASVSAAGTTGDFRVVDSLAGVSGTLVVNSTTPAWLGTSTKSFKCEDLSTANGVPGGTYDTVQLQFRRTAGAGTVKLFGFVTFE